MHHHVATERQGLLQHRAGKGVAGNRARHAGAQSPQWR
jgi:hypothetical protein